MFETLIFALALNLVGFMIAYPLKTDKLTDISYALTFFGIGLFNVLGNEMTVNKWLVVSVTWLWAIRLGSFLLYRVNKVGKDDRFDDMRSSFWLFGRFWLLQAITAWVVMLPTSFFLQREQNTEVSFVLFIGLGIAVVGLLIEAFADMQKFNFKMNKTNKGKWIDEGLWHYSRHPNYFGEIAMWSGVYVAVVSYLSENQPLYALASPVLIFVVLMFMSGVPILERQADKKWGHLKSYREYKNSTSLVIPLPKKG